MILKKYEALSENMKNNEVKEYYEILKHKKFSLIIKRFFDFFAALILLIILSPIMLILAIMIKLESKGPVFYRQERITKYGKKFRIFKFRTMVQDADKKGALVTMEQDPRITKVGNKIRKCRLDELPQLLNVIKGEMSFVGTRPEVEKYVNEYSNEMRATLLMPAGISSRASIEYKDEDEIINKYLSKGEKIDDIYVKRILPEKMKWNLEYIKKFSIWEDIKICFKTVF